MTHQHTEAINFP